MTKRFWQGMMAGGLVVLGLAAWLRPRVKPTTREQLARKGREMGGAARRIWRSSRERAGELRERIRP